MMTRYKARPVPSELRLSLSKISLLVPIKASTSFSLNFIIQQIFDLNFHFNIIDRFHFSLYGGTRDRP